MSEEIARADRAKRILDDELYQESFETVRAHLMRSWAKTDLKDVEEREQLFLQLKLLDKLKATLNYALDTGKVAIFKAEVERKKRESR